MITISWYQYLDVLRLQKEEFDYYSTIVPWACPNDGEPLSQGPGESTWFCKFDGWTYPRDWVRPERL